MRKGVLVMILSMFQSWKIQVTIQTTEMWIYGWNSQKQNLETNYYDLYLRWIFILIASLSLFHLDPSCILILVASLSSLHLDPSCILILVLSWSSLHLDPLCILILVASWSSLHLDPHYFFILVVSMYYVWFWPLLMVLWRQN